MWIWVSPLCAHPDNYTVKESELVERRSERSREEASDREKKQAIERRSKRPKREREKTENFPCQWTQASDGLHMVVA